MRLFPGRKKNANSWQRAATSEETLFSDDEEPIRETVRKSGNARINENFRGRVSCRATPRCLPRFIPLVRETRNRESNHARCQEGGRGAKKSGEERERRTRAEEQRAAFHLCPSWGKSHASRFYEYSHFVGDPRESLSPILPKPATFPEQLAHRLASSPAFSLSFSLLLLCLYVSTVSRSSFFRAASSLAGLRMLDPFVSPDYVGDMLRCLRRSSRTERVLVTATT